MLEQWKILVVIFGDFVYKDAEALLDGNDQSTIAHELFLIGLAIWLLVNWRICRLTNLPIISIFMG